jgi:hypothetical protein
VASRQVCSGYSRLGLTFPLGWLRGGRQSRSAVGEGVGVDLAGVQDVMKGDCIVVRSQLALRWANYPTSAGH